MSVVSNFNSNANVTNIQRNHTLELTKSTMQMNEDENLMMQISIENIALPNLRDSTSSAVSSEQEDPNSKSQIQWLKEYGHLENIQGNIRNNGVLKKNITFVDELPIKRNNQNYIKSITILENDTASANNKGSGRKFWSKVKDDSTNATFHGGCLSNRFNLFFFVGSRSRHFLRPYISEFIGTFLLTFFGTGAVAASVLTDSMGSSWQVASVWGYGVAIAIYVSRHHSGAHLNPAITVAFSLYTDFHWRVALGYIFVQNLGGVCAGLVNYWVYERLLENFETNHKIIRGQEGSQRSAAVFGEYYPNPNVFISTQAENKVIVTANDALLAEALGTAILTFTIFSLTDQNNKAVIKGMAPLFIGFTVAILTVLFSPLSQAGFNPARDFGPRIVAYFAGWNSVAIPGPQRGFWVFIVGPIIGAIIGGGLYFFSLRLDDRGIASRMGRKDLRDLKTNKKILPV
ncbi:hypothetical protein HDU92_008155 [Lobulomyces angularis]|nr:hypothetical protein HDU92_008155 [Lobulomyces angularis]